MKSREGSIERIVGKIEGKEKGNVFLIDGRHAVTVRHCVPEQVESVKLVFPKICEGGQEVEATVVSQPEEINDGWILLNLSEELPVQEITIAAVDLSRFTKAEVYGYDANHRVSGRWTRLSSGSSEIVNSDLLSDMLFDAVDNREKDFSGLSGSPIFIDGKVIGIVSQETLENKDAISIHGISVKSSIDFFIKNNIAINDETVREEYSSEGAMSIGEYRDRSIHISAGGEAALLSKLQGKYIEKLKSIVQRHRNGDVNGAWEELKGQTIELDADSLAGNDVRAEYYYKMAIWYMEDWDDISKAQKKYDKAKKLKPDLDGSIFLALKLSKNGDNLNAEELLEPVDTVAKLNIYLQICINTKKIEKAYEKYEELDGTLAFDGSTYYLLSVMELLRREYDKAMEHIDTAIAMDKKIPFFHLLKGVITYWKAIPQDVCLPDDLYPVMFANGLFKLEADGLELIRSAVENYRKAYLLAENVENKMQMEVILSAWINTLSVDYAFQNAIAEPLELLKKSDSYNVTALLYMIHRGMELDENVTIENLENHIKKCSNKIGYVIALLEMCLLQDDKKNAKRLLHEYKALFLQGDFYEYWYEYVVRTESDRAKFNEYEEEIRNNTELEPIRQKRLINLLLQGDCEREQELEEGLVEIYGQTDNRLDLLNLIHFCRTRRRWNGLLQYAQQLVDKYGDVYGSMYRIQGLIGLEEYELALDAIENLKKQQIAGFEKELLMNQMRVYERLGKYSEAIEAGQILLRKKPTEQLILNLASLYALNGDEEATLRTLLMAEEQDILTVTICQRISNCYLTKDNHKAWEYAKRAVDISEEQPEIMLWAANIGNHAGKSMFAGELYHKVMLRYPNHESFRYVGLDEILELIRESQVEADKRLEMLYSGDLAGHLFVDATKGNQTYAEYFYKQWEYGDVAPMEFGAHQYSEENLKGEITKIALDYSSCLLMHEMGVLHALADAVEQIYVVGDLFGIMSEELRAIPIAQPDIIYDKIKLIEKCREEYKIDFVEMKIPNELDGLDVKQTADAVSICTAEANGAVCVSDDAEDGDWRDSEVITALYRGGKISQETYMKYAVNEDLVREDTVLRLVQNPPRLLVDGVTLSKWDSFNLLPAVIEHFVILVEGSTEQDAINGKEQLEQKERICKQVKSLREELMALKENGKLSFLPMQERRLDMKYGGMLETLMFAAEKREIPLCVDDRFATSYSKVGKVPIYNTFDLLKHLRLVKKISLEDYCAAWKLALDKNIRYVLPDNEIILYALKLSDVNIGMGTLNESQLLKGIRKYIVNALAAGTHLCQKEKMHVQIPENEYFVFHLQRRSRELIRLIWQSGMTMEKKEIASEWVLCHYSQFAFDFSVRVGKTARMHSQAIQIADFLLAGILLSGNEEYTDAYYKWLYGWVGDYLENNAEIKKKALNYTKEFLSAHLRDGKISLEKREFAAVELMFAIGIYYMPEEFKAYVLKDNIIVNSFNAIYCEISIVLTQHRQVPVSIYKAWEQEMLALNEGNVLTKNFGDVVFQFSWEYIIPAFPGVIVKWKEGDKESEKRMFLDYGARLQYEQKAVRRNEYERIMSYLPQEHDEYYLQLMSSKRYEEAAKEILQMLQMSEQYEMLRIDRGISGYWFGDKTTWNLLLPTDPGFFKQFYDVENDAKLTNTEAIIKIPIQLGVMPKIEVNNNNPVRLLHRLAWQFSQNKSEQEILATITSLFSFCGESNKQYGKIYVLFLKCVWKLFNELEVYKIEKRENLIVWSYIWADMMMSSITRLDAEGIVNIEAYVEQLQKDMEIELDTDGVGDEINEDVLSPESMNLFRICVNGTVAICCKYEQKMRIMAKDILTVLHCGFKEWLSSPVHFLEAELLYGSKNNAFQSIFVDNTYSLIEQLTEVLEVPEIFAAWMIYACVPNRRQHILLGLLGDKGIDINELIYLFFITRESISSEDIDLIEAIIEKQILQREMILDMKNYRFISAIVSKLSEDFQGKYKQSELIRIGNALSTGKLQWVEAEELVIEIAKAFGNDVYFSFWESYEEVLNEEAALQLAERIGWMQLRVTFEEADRVRELRMRLELRK